MFWLFRGDFDVGSILPIIVQIVTGVLGGQAVGAVLQQVAMSQLTKIQRSISSVIDIAAGIRRSAQLRYRGAETLLSLALNPVNPFA